jgi:hypothetical protein
MPRNPSREIDSTDHVFQRLATVDQACARYCLTRPKIYLLARENPKIMRRLFGRTVVDLAVMDELVDALPTANESRIAGRTGLKFQPAEQPVEPAA